MTGRSRKGGKKGLPFLYLKQIFENKLDNSY